jgi:phage I-like protein
MDGLFGEMLMTDLGKPLVDGGQYRTLSPVFTLEQIGQAQDGRPRMRPVALHSIGLTNKPNLKGMIPLSMPEGCSVNKEEWFEDEKPETGNLKPETDLKNNKAGEAGTRKETRMKEVLKALGLAEDADETAALTALNKLKETAGAITANDAELQTAKNRVQELERKELEREADAFISANADRIAKPDEVKKLYCSNKDATVSLVAAMKPPVAGVKPIVLNRADGKTPDQTSSNKSVERDAAVRKLIAENKARTRSEAWALGATMNPELFKE